MPRVNFPLDRYGFQFANHFRNVIAELPGGRKIELNGRCGGMSFAALDHFFAARPTPTCRPADFAPGLDVPPDGSPLADYIMRRHYHSLSIPAVLNVFLWTVLPDHSTFFAKGVRDRTLQQEWPKLRQAIDQGRPVSLILVQARDLAHVGLNHQVVAYGYDAGADGGSICVYLYDCNHPNEEATLMFDPAAQLFVETCPSGGCGERWRGFFVHPTYAPATPPVNLSHLLPVRLAAARSKAAIAESVSTRAPASDARRRFLPLVVTFERVTFENPHNPNAGEEVALALSVNDQTVRWPRTGGKVAAHGRRYALKQHIPIAVDKDGVLEVSVALANSAYEALAEADESVGCVTVLHSKADKWGRGKHVVCSEGDAGRFIVEYTVAAGRAAKDRAAFARRSKSPSKERPA
ncbi:MAG: hypothetical protein RMN25_10095 [Anaerolineae bacterium]|nr:hypothetical protein [Thermoflexales bacterium]MDW8408119.1 hypothetical protein [Anaerolineae bacterium]